MHRSGREGSWTTTTFTRRSLLALAATALAAPLLRAVPAAAGDDALVFLVIGDWGDPAHASDLRRVARGMARTAEKLAPAFVVSVGDNFYPGGVRDTDDPLWREMFEDMFDAAALGCPWYPVLGNHDHKGNPEAEILYSASSRRWRMPARYYRHTATTPQGAALELFFLDTNALVRLNEFQKWVRYPQTLREQVRWLEEGLKTSPANWKVVVGHHPLHSGGFHGGEATLQKILEPLLVRYRVQAYINGHDHHLERIERDGVNYVTCGSGSEARPVPTSRDGHFLAARLGFASILIGERMEIRFHDADGAVLHRAYVHRR
ncbi:Acid phosphatase [Lutibaculum baratangense AMV1]|uniref:acid phosphatase n=1 Tax=Lutibaculum baratangense AMV1 TaxID=631454 RepID=V4RF27_9HYPH|nr:Acid phosphatase [Lutibaculum baratangense AMV1]